MYQRITNPLSGSGQIHLLFDPELFLNLDERDYSHLMINDGGIWYWKHPTTGVPMTNLQYYDDKFFEELIKTGRLMVMGKDRWLNGLNGIEEFLELIAP